MEVDSGAPSQAQTGQRTDPQPGQAPGPGWVQTEPQSWWQPDSASGAGFADGVASLFGGLRVEHPDGRIVSVLWGSPVPSGAAGGTSGSRGLGVEVPGATGRHPASPDQAYRPGSWQTWGTAPRRGDAAPAGTPVPAASVQPAAGQQGRPRWWRPIHESRPPLPWWLGALLLAPQTVRRTVSERDVPAAPAGTGPADAPPARRALPCRRLLRLTAGRGGETR
jgi:hypothetical protein